MAISNQQIEDIAKWSAKTVVKRECFDLVDHLGSVLINMGAAYSQELEGDRARARFWIHNGKRELAKLYSKAPHLKETIDAIDEGLDKIAECEPFDYPILHNMVEFEVVHKLADDFTACQCGKTESRR